MDISIILSVLAFIMSFVTWVVHAFQHSTRLSIKNIDYRVWPGDIVQLFVYIQNNSVAPITISGLSILESGRKFPCELVSKKIRSENGIVTRSTPNFPLNFSSSQGSMYFLEFVHCPGIALAPNKTVAFEIYTNRGCLKKFSVPGQQGRLFRLR